MKKQHSHPYSKTNLLSTAWLIYRCTQYNLAFHIRFKLRIRARMRHTFAKRKWRRWCRRLFIIITIVISSLLHDVKIICLKNNDTQKKLCTRTCESFGLLKCFWLMSYVWFWPFRMLLDDKWCLLQWCFISFFSFSLNLFSIACWLPYRPTKTKIAKRFSKLWTFQNWLQRKQKHPQVILDSKVINKSVWKYSLAPTSITCTVITNIHHYRYLITVTCWKENAVIDVDTV